MSSSYRPLEAAPPASPASDRAASSHDATLGGVLARAVAAGWGETQPQTWCDTAFGAGWTFLALWRAWQQADIRPRRLHVVGVVDRPYTRAALAEVWSINRKKKDIGWTGCAHALLAQWPDVLPGQHRLTFDQGRVSLTLLFGDPTQTLPRAGFLADGFLSVNAGGGHESFDGVVALLARHAAPNARWWAAPDPALHAAWRQVAFVPKRLADDGDGEVGKLMLAQRRAEVPLRGQAALRPRAWDGERSAVVVGAGVAGAHVAHALARRGWRVAVLSCDRPHDGHTCAAVTPVVARDDDARARLTRAGAECAASVWRQLAILRDKRGKSGAASRTEIGAGAFEFGLTPQVRWKVDAPLQSKLEVPPPDSPSADDLSPFWVCGTVQVDKPTGRAGDLADTLTHLNFPSEWVRAVDRDTASQLARMPLSRGGLYFSSGMRVQPALLLEQLLDHPNITLITGQANALKRVNGHWQVLDAVGSALAHGTQCVLAAAAHTPDLLATSGLLDPLPVLAAMHRLAGEVTAVPAIALDGGPACVVAGEGYVLPALDGEVLIGSTYVRSAKATQVSAVGQRVTLDKLQALVAHPAVDALVQQGAGQASPQWPGWAGWRAVVAGRLPQVGPVSHAPGLWLATAYGSRGLTWAALAGEMIAGSLDGEPDILDTDLARQIAPR